MRHLIRLSALALAALTGMMTHAQNPGSAIVFIWNDVLYAQSLTTDALIRTALPSGVDFPATSGEVFTYDETLLADVALDGYGFYQGVRSADGTTLAFLAIQQEAPGYRVIAVENGQADVLFSGVISPERGYLVPVAWAGSDTLILLERHGLHTLDAIRLWQYDGALSLRFGVRVPPLSGNSVTLPGGWVFAGFDTLGMQAYLVNVKTGQVLTKNTSFALQPPASVFEVYPVKVVGATDLDAFKAWLASEPSVDAPESGWTGTPFLHWPLPDMARSVTCYPDSAWTDANHAVECPGLATPRAYPGHEGTDVGGKPDGLPIGTHVYAAAPGLVVATHTGCPRDDVTCGDAYGNVILLEHTRVSGHDVETWFTGYAHLDATLVERHTYIREIGLPIGLSGQSGLGGAHLHFEVRMPQHPSLTNWIDPWDSSSGANLWVDGSDRPLAAAVAFPPPALLTCTTSDGNNIRRGPGTEHEVAAKSEAALMYEVFQVETIESGGTPGEWYHVRWGDAGASGWLYAALTTDCIPASG